MRKYWGKKVQLESTSTMSKATKQAACFIEARRGVAVVKQEPAIDPTVLLYLLESFKLNKIASHCSALIISYARAA